MLGYRFMQVVPHLSFLPVFVLRRHSGSWKEAVNVHGKLTHIPPTLTEITSCSLWKGWSRFELYELSISILTFWTRLNCCIINETIEADLELAKSVKLPSKALFFVLVIVIYLLSFTTAVEVFMSPKHLLMHIFSNLLHTQLLFSTHQSATVMKWV